MKLEDLWPSNRLTEVELLNRAKNHLSIIFGDRLQMASERGNERADLVALIDGKHLLVFEVKQPKREFALGFAEISQLVALRDSNAGDQLASFILLTGREVSPTSRRLLLEHGVHVVKVGDSVSETIQSLKAEFPEAKFLRNLQAR